MEHQENTLLWRFVYIKVWPLTWSVRQVKRCKWRKDELEHWMFPEQIYFLTIYTARIILLCLYISHFTCQNFIRTIFLWYFKHSKTLQKIWNLTEELSNIRHWKGWDCYLGNWRGGVVCWYCFGCQENPTKGICASTSGIDYLGNFGQIISFGGKLPFSFPRSCHFISRCRGLTSAGN